MSPMLSKLQESKIEIGSANQPIHIRRRFEDASKARIHQWLAEAIGVFSMVGLDDAQHLARAGAQIATTVLGSGRAISIDLLLDGSDVEIRLGMEGASGSQAVLHHHAARQHVDGKQSIH
jgi:hypothetical protein